MANKKLTFKEQMEGFPYWQIFVICCARISEPIAFSSLFPYVYFLTRDFHIAKTEAEIARYAGYLSSAFSLAQMGSSLEWSRFSQKKGRKITIMLGICGSIFSILLLGFSRNYYMALSARFFMGLLNGNLACLRTTIAEVCEWKGSKKHQPLAFSTFPLLWNIGCIIGPLLSSSLVHPKNDGYYDNKSFFSIKASGLLTKIFPSLHSLNEKYPYALANIVISVFLFNSLIVVFFFLEETHYSKRFEYDFGLDMGDKILSFLNIRQKAEPRMWELKSSNEVAPILTGHQANAIEEEAFDYDESDDENEVDDLNSVNAELISETSSLNSAANTRNYGSIRKKSRRESIGPFNRRESISLIKTLSRASEIRIYEEENDDTKIPWKALRNPMCYSPILANILLNIHGICYTQFLPVFLSNDIVFRKDGWPDLEFPFRISGGLGYSTEQVGKVISITGFVGMLVIILIYPYVDRNYPSTKTYSFLHYILIPSYIFFPLSVFTLPDVFKIYQPGESKSFFWTNITLYTLTFGEVFTTSMLYPLVQYLTHVGAPPKHRAIINSLAITGSSFAKFLAPLLGGFVMSFGFSHHIGWLFFYMLGFLAIIGLIQSYQLVEDAEEEPSTATPV